MGKQQTILVIEDEPRILKTLSLMFQTAGYTTHQASTAKAAILLMSKEKVDVVLLDLNLPDMDGISLLKYLRGLNPKIPVLVLTGDSSPEMYQAAYNMGVKAYLEKPAEPALIVQSIGTVLQSTTIIQ
jgi:two-component system KDP operon response regulator KdpE